MASISLVVDAGLISESGVGANFLLIRHDEGKCSVVDQLAQFFTREALRIVVAAVPESGRQRPSLFPILLAPPRMCRLNYVHVFHFQCVTRFIFRQQDFVQFFTGANTDVLNLTAWGERFRHLKQAHAGNLRYEDLSAMHLFQATDDKTDPSFQRDPEARHARIGQSDFPVLALLKKNRDDAASAAQHVAITRATESRVLLARISVR